jgi:hypothetical protein
MRASNEQEKDTKQPRMLKDMLCVTSSDVDATRSSGRQAAGLLASPTVTGDPAPLPDSLQAAITR